MFPSRYFNPKYWASRFWPKVGGNPPSSQGNSLITGIITTPAIEPTPETNTNGKAIIRVNAKISKSNVSARSNVTRAK